ncbi:MAG: hypothetical protein AB7I42_26660, partial [Bradyrhizobium sp.]|uniref:hypothetical protein n=1 Tax=Bradyrhizobium sp. TaxID=376 RepID=UPI003D124C11
MDTIVKAAIRFLESRVVDDWRKGTPAEERYEEGKVYELEPRSADRWVKRGLAEFVDPASATIAQGASSNVGNQQLDRTKADQGSDTGQGDGEEIDLDKLKKDELEALAEERGVDISDAKTKADIIKALEAKR